MRDLLQRIASSLFLSLQRQWQFTNVKRASRAGYLVIGEHSYGVPNVHLYKGSESKVIIGKYCSLAPGVTFITGGIHPANWVSTYPFRSRWNLPGADRDGMPFTKGNIVVGSDVRIGTDAMILSGVTIGHGAIIAARAVVTRDIPAYAIAAGVPARVVSMRFDEQVVRRLLRVAWWEWDEAKIRGTIPLLSSPQVESFLQACEHS